MPTQRRLKSASDLRRFLANVICRVEKGEIEESLAGKLGYLSNILYRVIEGTETERRICRLEEKLFGGQK